MSTIDDVLKRIRKESDDEDIPSVSEERGAFLRDLVAKHKPERILEVGTAIGYSTLCMAQALPKGSTIVTVEINPALGKRAAKNFIEAGVGDRTEVVTGDALQILPNLPGPFDLVFLDAEKSSYLTYLQDVEPQLSPRAVVVADNVERFKGDMRDYLAYVRKSGKYESETHEFADDKMEVSVSTQ